MSEEKKPRTDPPRKTQTPRRRQASGYGDAGASLARRALQGFIAKSGAPSEDIDFHNYTLRQRGRMLYMSSPVAAAAINTNRTKVVGTGLYMKCAIDRETLGLSEEAAKEWQRKTEKEFRMWASDKRKCDALGLNNFWGLQQLVIKSWLMSGDVFSLHKRYKTTPMNPYSLRLHIIEADRISTPIDMVKTVNPTNTQGVNSATGNKICDGVEVDGNGCVVAYYIRNTYPYQVTAEKTTWQRVLAVGEKTGLPNILQIMSSERPDQYRGVTYLAQVVEPLLQLRRYTESTLMAALVQSFFTAWITTQTEHSEIPFNEVGAGDIDGIPDDDPDSISEDENEYEMGPGTVQHLKDGESITFGNPNIPTASFESFFKTMCKMVGATLEMPYDVLIKEFNSSYSAAKGALEEAWEAFKMRRVWLVDDFCQPTYEAWLAEAVAIGRIKAPGFFTDPLIKAAWCGTRWDGPAQTHLDPKKEADANELAVKHGWKTNEQVTREFYGGNWEENIEIVKRENEMKPSATPSEPPAAPAVQTEPPDPTDPPDPNNTGNQTTGGQGNAE